MGTNDPHSHVSQRSHEDQLGVASRCFYEQTQARHTMISTKGETTLTMDKRHWDQRRSKCWSRTCFGRYTSQLLAPTLWIGLSTS